MTVAEAVDGLPRRVASCQMPDQPGAGPLVTSPPVTSPLAARAPAAGPAAARLAYAPHSVSAAQARASRRSLRAFAPGCQPRVLPPGRPASCRAGRPAR